MTDNTSVKEGLNKIKGIDYFSNFIYRFYVGGEKERYWVDDDIEESCNGIDVEELYEFNEITPHGFTLDKIAQELKNLKLAPVMWMDGEDTVVTL